MENIIENRIKIIIVEDEEQVSTLIYQVLCKIEWLEIVVVKSVKEFWENYEFGLIGGIILDLNLGNTVDDGINLAEKLREIDINIFIFVITGYQDVVNSSKLLNSGIDDFLLKPFDITILRSRLFLMFSRLRRWENMRKLYDANSQYYEERLVQLKELFCYIKKRISLNDREVEKIENIWKGTINGKFSKG